MSSVFVERLLTLCLQNYSKRTQVAQKRRCFTTPLNWIYLFSNHTGQHTLSLLTIVIVLIYKVRRKFGWKVHKIFENRKILRFLSFLVSI